MDKKLQRALNKIRQAKKKKKRSLDLSGLGLTKIPELVFELSYLSSLDLRNNQLSSVPESITKLSYLSNLYLSNNQLSSVSKNIMKLSNLSSLHLNYNELSSVSESITRLSNLKRLYLSNNQLSSVSESITKLSNLSVLDLSYNELSSVSDSITKLSNLRMLYLSNNQLSSVPESITKLSNLRELYLNNNQLSIVPESITKLNNLSVLNLRDNPIKTPPLEVANRGIPAIKEYFARQKAEGTAKIYEAKLLVVGAGGVGKTTLSEKIKDANYILKPESDDISTEGIDIMEYQFKGKEENNFRLNIWDFGGQSIYHYTHQFFLTKRSLYLLVTDSRKEDEDLNYWLNVQQLLTGASPVFIIQNEKQGKVKNLKESEIRERFPNVKRFLRTNLKDNTGLEAIVNRVEAEVQLLPHIGTSLPKSWAAIRKKLEDLNLDYISLDKYLAICAQHGIEEAPKALILSGYLHDIGVMLHFQDDPILERLVILNNEWGTDAVYKVIDYGKVIEEKGRFTYNDLKAIWYESQYVGKHLELVTLMEKFKLCYKIPETKQYIAPARLPVEKVKYDWDSRANTQFRYRYKFMPKGILTRFIVEMHHYIKDQKLMWNTGVVLEKEDTLAEVVELYGENEIRIRIKGQHPERLRPLIMERIDRINSTFTNLKVAKLIPCNCETCLTDKENPPTFYREEKLLDRKAHNKREIECDKSPYKDADVFKMLNDYRMVAADYRLALAKNAKALIRNGELAKAFELLEGMKENDSFRKDDLAALSSRFYQLEREVANNTISREQYVVEKAKITKSLLGIATETESLGRH